MRELDDITGAIVHASVRLPRDLGPGLLESVYEAVEGLASVHGKQLLTYLKLTNLPVGLLINFGAATLREGLQRIVNGLPAPAAPRLRVNQSEPDTSGLRPRSPPERHNDPTRSGEDPTE